MYLELNFPRTLKLMIPLVGYIFKYRALNSNGHMFVSAQLFYLSCTARRRSWM